MDAFRSETPELSRACARGMTAATLDKHAARGKEGMGIAYFHLMNSSRK
jgi:hypothetical protein